MKVLLAQINPLVGDIEGNALIILKILNKYNADLFVFPELSITGYIPQDLLLRERFIDENLKCLNKIIKSSKGKSIVVGFIDRIKQDILNSAAIIQNGELSAVYHKQCLPNYHVFDEKRWFKAGYNPKILNISGRIFGINICEDIWFPEITKWQANEGAEIIINISASPFSAGKIQKIESVIMSRHKENNNIPIIYVNQVGAQDGIVFYGHSMFVKGGKIKACKDFAEDVLVVEIK